MELKEKLHAIGIDGKIRLLNFTLKKTDGVMTTSDEEVAVRQKRQLTKIILSLSDLKQEIEEKFIAGDSEKIVTEWSESIEKTIALGDEKVKQLNEYI